MNGYRDILLSDIVTWSMKGTLPISAKTIWAREWDGEGRYIYHTCLLINKIVYEM